jgi:opacity protein-like surface antigen
MKKFLTTGLLFLAGVQGGLAADYQLRPAIPAEAVYRQVVAQPAPTWQGCYGGVNLGIGVSNTRTNLKSNEIFSGNYIENSAMTSANPIAGGQIGCNDVNNNLLWGFELEGELGSVHGHTNESQTDPVSYSLNAKSRYQVDIAARAGYVVDNLLLYGKLGLAYRSTEYTMNSNELSYLTTPFKTLSDGTVLNRPLWNTVFDARRVLKSFVPLFGVGVEYAFASKWTAKLEMDTTYTDKKTDLVVTTLGPYNNRKPPYDNGSYIGYDYFRGRNPVLGDKIRMSVTNFDMNMKMGVNRRF